MSEEEISLLKEKDEVADKIDNITLEAKFVAKRIDELLKSKEQIYDKKKGEYRAIEYRDIAVLLRATLDKAPIFEKEILDLGYQVFSDVSKEYLESTEVETILSYLKIIDNPDNDIALVTVLRSKIYNFTDNDLLKIRLCDKNSSYYKALITYSEAEKEEVDLLNRVKKFLADVEEKQSEAEYIPLNELIWKIYVDTGYYNYVSLMPGGVLRQANLKMLFERAKEYDKVSFSGLFNFIKFIEKLKSSNSDLSAAKIIGENDNVIRIMSIHKSKGLEFPVVFICNSGKRFNFKDLNNNIILHQDLGLGIKYINYDSKVEHTMPVKEAIKVRAKKEIISEEMRIFYVALTRAREKLIITGVVDDIEKRISKKKEMLNGHDKKLDKIEPYIVSNFVSYLDWIELVMLNNKEEMDKVLEVCYHSKEELLEKNGEEIEEENKFVELAKEQKDKEPEEEISNVIKWEYKYLGATTIAGKTSVSKLKAKKSEEISGLAYDTEMKPKFMEGELKISAAERGTLVHLVLQKLDLSRSYTKEEVEKLISNLIETRIITSKQAEVIDITKILEFTKTDIASRIKSAKGFYKEVPFYLSIPAEEIYEEVMGEEVLVQGIIDLYFIDEDDKIVLLDYKTDNVKTGEELVIRYKEQLDLYKRALEKALNKKVDEVYIYSTSLAESIKV